MASIIIGQRRPQTNANHEIVLRPLIRYRTARNNGVRVRNTLPSSSRDRLEKKIPSIVVEAKNKKTESEHSFFILTTPMLGTMGYALFFYFVNEQVNANLFKDWIYYWIYLFSDSRRELIKGILSKLNAGDGL